MTPETLDRWRILPRLMMLVMTGVYIRCIEWALSQPELTTQQAGLISVITGAMTGSFAIWMGASQNQKGWTENEKCVKIFKRIWCAILNKKCHDECDVMSNKIPKRPR